MDILMNGLTLVEGHAYEVLVSKLRGNKIPFKITQSPKQRGPRHFFRSSELVVGYDCYDKILEVLGNPNHRIGHALTIYAQMSYHGRYSISPEFDFSQLHGKVTFDHGYLLETTVLLFKR